MHLTYLTICHGNHTTSY